jgi:hypothetical protein
MLLITVLLLFVISFIITKKFKYKKESLIFTVLTENEELSLINNIVNNLTPEECRNEDVFHYTVRGKLFKSRGGAIKYFQSSCITSDKLSSILKNLYESPKIQQRAKYSLYK